MEHRRQLERDELAAVLDFLEVGREAPSRGYLGRLQRAYKRHVPWETASRVVRASEVEALGDRPRRPAEFWALAIAQGSGGTCFESDYAYWSLLTALGFEAGLHVNDMPQHGGVHHHAALSVVIDGGRYLSDVGMGLELAAPIPLLASGMASAGAPSFKNELRRTASNRWRLELHGSRERLRLDAGLVYEFIDRRWDLDDYDAQVVRDYGPGGLFLDAVRVTRTFGDGTTVRFSPPDTLLRFDGERWSEELLPAGDRASQIADLVGMPAALLRRAFELVAAMPPKGEESA
ncbi:MAG: arylamine N-acetyltransferase [Chloroflexi bacterium]|nr:arylamine N-acetyltransferase [Chloroflexota bacterium]MDA1147416.1 arylamine N-acetyltransferase [Chloroflexota bacterium]